MPTATTPKKFAMQQVFEILLQKPSGKRCRKT